MTPRPVQTELQLSAMAAAVDRINKPAWLGAVGIALIMVALLFTAVSFRTLRREGAILRAEAREAGAVNELIALIEAEKAKVPDLDKLYLVQPNMGSLIEEKSKAIDFNSPPTIGTKRLRPIAANRFVTSSYVECRVNNEPLEKIFRWIAEVQSSKMLAGVFVSKLDLTPVAPDWSATLHFRVYEKAEKSR